MKRSCYIHECGQKSITFKLRNTTFKLRNITFKLRNITFKLRNSRNIRYKVLLFAFLLFSQQLKHLHHHSYLYELDEHLDRFLRSASMAKIHPPFDRSRIRTILIQTASASKCLQGTLRCWLSAGPGDFYLSPSNCLQSSLYVVAYETHLPEFKGSKVVTSTIPMKSPQFAVMKSVNYLPNVLSKMEAEENGAFVGIWMDEEGYVAEGPNMNVAFLTEERELIMPEFDKILSGCTAKRVLVLAEKLVKEGRIRGVGVRKVGAREGKMAKEMMLIGSGILVMPVLQWDEQIIGDGKEGQITEVLFNLIVEDMRSGPPSVRVPLP